MFTCSTLLLFPYPVPADIHGSVQHVTLKGVPVDVLPRLFLWFSQVKHLECPYICPPQEVQCVHMYSVAWNELCGEELRWAVWEGVLWGAVRGGTVGGAVGGCCPAVRGAVWGRCVCRTV